ncbi:MAG: pyridine nucleotide-disulfide oxidoreductase, partial [Cycloclasticus sp.]|nr:pyridine nucleotide-disulfide oxidoreductase [Cycloclasticus sp.]
MLDAKKTGLIVFLALFVLGFYMLGFNQYLDLSVVKEKSTDFIAYYEANRWQTSLWFFLIYIVTTAISIPGASVLTL